MANEKIKQKVASFLQVAIENVEAARKTTWDLWDVAPAHKAHTAKLDSLKKALIRLQVKYSTK